MNRIVIVIGLLLFTGLALCEISSILYRFRPETANIYYDLFLSPSYHFKITVLWYIYELANILNRIIWCYCFAFVALKYSRNLYWVGITFVFYQFTQFFFYIWNRNSSFVSNFFVYVCMLFVILEIVIPSRNSARIKSIE